MLMPDVCTDSPVSFIVKLETESGKFQMSPKFENMIHNKFEVVIMETNLLPEKLKKRWKSLRSVEVKAKLLVFYEGLNGKLEEPQLIDHLVDEWTAQFVKFGQVELYSVVLPYKKKTSVTGEDIQRISDFLISNTSNILVCFEEKADVFQSCLRYKNSKNGNVFCLNVLTFFIGRNNFDVKKKTLLDKLFEENWNHYLKHGPIGTVDHILTLKNVITQLFDDVNFEEIIKKYGCCLHKNSIFSETPTDTTQ